jgi:GT2 family glycosyltransferase
MGWEDADLGARAWGRGWATLYVPASLVHHKSSASIKRFYSVHERAALGFRNGALWLAANGPAAELWKALLLLPVTVAGCLLTGRFALLDGLVRSFARLPRALRRRCDDCYKGWWRAFSALPSNKDEA